MPLRPIGFWGDLSGGAEPPPATFDHPSGVKRGGASPATPTPCADRMAAGDSRVPSPLPGLWGMGDRCPGAPTLKAAPLHPGLQTGARSEERRVGEERR